MKVDDAGMKKAKAVDWRAEMSEGEGRWGRRKQVVVG